MKLRLDVALTERNLAPSREKAKALIMAGQVYVDGQKAYKAGETVDDDQTITVKEELPFVSRGGYKLDKGVKVFGIDLTDKICVDIGASTGGFTDCMLQNGAEKVYAVDVGYGQLAWSLRNDPRVVNMERTNIRYVTDEHIPEKLQFASIDVSFISLSLVLKPCRALMSDDAEVVCLIKPQFEAGREKVGKKGVVRDPAVHLEVLENVLEYIKEAGFIVCGLTFSPIKGPEGNIEYLAYLKTVGEENIPNLKELVDESHAALKG